MGNCALNANAPASRHTAGVWLCLTVPLHAWVHNREHPVPDRYRFTHVELILLLTAFAAGAVDVISFATLGGVFASAMTGNFALLAYYVAQSDSQAAMGSVVALSGFVVGCAIGILQRRGRAQAQAVSLLLASETGLLLFFALYAVCTAGRTVSPPERPPAAAARTCPPGICRFSIRSSDRFGFIMSAGISR